MAYTNWQKIFQKSLSIDTWVIIYLLESYRNITDAMTRDLCLPKRLKASSVTEEEIFFQHCKSRLGDFRCMSCLLLIFVLI